jgi:hypothetical protein
VKKLKLIDYRNVFFLANLKAKLYLFAAVVNTIAMVISFAVAIVVVAVAVVVVVIKQTFNVPFV